MFIVATIFSWLGITFYRTFLFSYSWRWVYVVSTTLTVLFSIMQLCLVFRLNVKWGINDLAFALGDDAVANFVSAMQFLPTVTMVGVWMCVYVCVCMNESPLFRLFFLSPSLTHSLTHTHTHAQTNSIFRCAPQGVKAWPTQC